jgi:hypothetical protein
MILIVVTTIHNLSRLTRFVKKKMPLIFRIAKINAKKKVKRPKPVLRDDFCSGMGIAAGRMAQYAKDVPS